MAGNIDKMLLTTTGVADLLKVHSSTIKRWSEEGNIEAGKTKGGHRRFHLNDVLQVARQRQITTFLDPFHPWEANAWLAISESSQGGDYRRLHSLAMEWLRQGETDLLTRLFYVIGNHRQNPFTAFLDQGVRGFMKKVGEEWLGGRLPVGEEHMATQVMTEALIRLRTGWDETGLRSPVPRDPPPVAVVGAVEGDAHEIGALSIRILLEREGWRVFYLGGNVPMEELSAVQEGQGASLVCVSFPPGNTLPDLQRAVRVLGKFYRPQRPYALALGGTLGDQSQGLAMEEGPFDAISLSRSAEEFLSWAKTLPQAPISNSKEPRRVA